MEALLESSSDYLRKKENEGKTITKTKKTPYLCIRISNSLPPLKLSEISFKINYLSLTYQPTIFTKVLLSNCQTMKHDMKFRNYYKLLRKERKKISDYSFNLLNGKQPFLIIKVTDKVPGWLNYTLVVEQNSALKLCIQLQ